MNNPRLVHLSTLLLITIFLFGCSSSKTSIEGKVYRSDSKQPNENAHVAIFDSKVTFENLPSSDPIYETTTNSKGQYKFDNVVEGAYQILISLPGSDPALSTCTKIPDPGLEWLFYSLSYDAVGNPDTIKYRTDKSFNIAAGENLSKDFSWTCK